MYTFECSALVGQLLEQRETDVDLLESIQVEMVKPLPANSQSGVFLVFST